METKNQLPYLPHELIIQILLKLPVKSLLCFKCVCKSWFSIISDSRFASSQFDLTAATHAHRALFVLTSSTHEARSVDLEALLDDDADSVSFNLNFILSQPYSYSPIEIKGSCRGFILFYCSSSFYLWNPSTGLHRQIPLSPHTLSSYAYYFNGFGYDRSTNDYLIVSMLSSTKSSNLAFFSLRANKSEQIDEGTHIHYSNAMEDYRKAGSLFNGVIHWFAYRRYLEKDVIVAFDLMERKLLDMNLLNEFHHELHNCGLWVFQEFLSLWASNDDNDRVEIWVMKEYRVHSSWTKTYVLPTDDIPYFSPLCCTKSGDIVGTNGHFRLAKYNDEGHLLVHRCSYFSHDLGSHVVMYTESLLSLPGDNLQAFTPLVG